jgi:hypothetical protein
MIKKTLLVLTIILAALPTFGSTIQEGRIMRVRQLSLWFFRAEDLNAWIRDKINLAPGALQARQDSLLRSRDVWQFDEHQVRILKYRSTEHMVEVEVPEFDSKPKFRGVHWWLEDKDIE